MALLHVLSYLGGLAGFLFVTLSLASGLLWLAELIEEYSKYAKTIGMRAIYGIIALHLILIVTDSLPILPTLFSILCHLVYLSNFSSSWPFISLTSPRFVVSCLLVVGDHFIWFFHFAARAQEAKKYRGPKYRYGGNAIKGVDDAPAFMDVAAFFAICVWFVPLFLFLSLSANDNALPSNLVASAPPSPGPGHTIDLSTPQVELSRQLHQRASKSLVKSVLDPLLSVLPRMRRRRRDDEGILAPRTPVRGSPLHSPVLMAQNYFPWGGDDSNGGSGSNHNHNLAPDSIRSPGPPRRVQSEVQVNRAGVNPRGIATRNGRPPFPAGDEPDDFTLGGGGTASPKRGTSPEPRMSLGPKGDSGPVDGPTEVIEGGIGLNHAGGGAVKRRGKAD
ncbi:transmembrane adaptor Erv26-domain-containing protein [Naematelia encephala]|uniref:Transmembrane adaptor Erv26-domain-containing protein n=1 Tax=Naematelia encephala TaxID=71784 RepID=A0A1Y2AZQ3_9TREE|nr:transmembrane adaptor Erv26-domain-containing protein [Naematelia encephala]